jgi:hypothetical protein
MALISVACADMLSSSSLCRHGGDPRDYPFSLPIYHRRDYFLVVVILGAQMSLPVSFLFLVMEWLHESIMVGVSLLQRVVR